MNHPTERTETYYSLLHQLWIIYSLVSEIFYMKNPVLIYGKKGGGGGGGGGGCDVTDIKTTWASPVANIPLTAYGVLFFSI